MTENRVLEQIKQPLNYFHQRFEEDWLVGYDSGEFNAITEEFLEKFDKLNQQKNSPKIILAETEPLHFFGAFIAALSTECRLFLCNPNWGHWEWQKVLDLVQPDLILGQPKHLPDFLFDSVPLSYQSLSCLLQTPSEKYRKSWVMIPTGGSSGKIRFTIHTWETLTASVQGFCNYFDKNSINSFCILPLYHVSGLMQFMRTFITKGKLVILPYNSLKKETDLSLNINCSNFFISLVPTQLQTLIELGKGEWLASFKTVLLGGAPASKTLLNAARNYQIPLALTYGMTETASQIITLKPEEFLAGNESLGQVLPHATVKISSPNDSSLNQQQIGQISIQSSSLCLGYYPHLFASSQAFKTDDLGYFDENNYLYLQGRWSQKIITGGENVFPCEIEEVIFSTQLVKDVCVIGVDDPHWGQAITALYVPENPDISSEQLQLAIQDQISNFKYPKYWISLEILPRNLQGKVNFRQLREIAQTCLQL